jgi:hypothetical protein
MKNHEQGTIEFRFFSACEHRDKNIKMFLSYFIKELNKKGSGAKVKTALSDAGNKNIISICV